MLRGRRAFLSKLLSRTNPIDFKLFHLSPPLWGLQLQCSDGLGMTRHNCFLPRLSWLNSYRQITLARSWSLFLRWLPWLQSSYEPSSDFDSFFVGRRMLLLSWNGQNRRLVLEGRWCEASFFLVLCCFASFEVLMHVQIDSFLRDRHPNLIGNDVFHYILP